MIQNLYSFDFDDTLCMTPNQTEGKEIWKKHFGFDFPAKNIEQSIDFKKRRITGWWGREESLDLDIFEIPVNDWVYQQYLKAASESDSYLILATGRLDKSPNMRSRVENILQKHNLSFDEVYLNWGMDTFKFKCMLFERLINKLNPQNFIMYDDRQEHLLKFNDWAESQTIPVTIIDVVNKESKTFNK